MKIYNLIYNEKTFSAAFFRDDVFGSFLFTEKKKESIDFPKHCDIMVDGDNALVVTGKENKYTSYKIERKNGYVYAFAAVKDYLDENAVYLTMEELDDVNSCDLFTGGDCLEYLANIVKLPNGNYVVGRVQDYISVVEDLKGIYPDKETFFRGHYSYKYALVPSLYRKKKYYDNEDSMYMDFKTQFYNELSNKKYIEVLTTMQHYKMPTRLLDTTSNPLVALWMSCDKPQNYKTKGYGIGEVIVMNADKKDVKYSDSIAVTIMSSLACLETRYKQELYDKIAEAKEKNDPSVYLNCTAYKRFRAEVAHELPSFDEEIFNPDTLLRPRHVRVGMINERIIAQSGSFILFGLCDYITGEYSHLDTVTKERVFIVHRDYILSQLEMLNIHRGTMYPDKDHMSTVIMKSYEDNK